MIAALATSLGIAIAIVGGAVIVLRCMPAKKEKAAAGEFVASIKDAINLTGLPIITLYVHNHQDEYVKFNFLLDTGSTGSFINKSHMSIVSKSDVIGKDSVIGFGAEANDVEFRRVPLVCDGKTLVWTFGFVDLEDAFNTVKRDNGVTLHGIIGNDFFTKYKYVIDFDTLKVYSK